MTIFSLLKKVSKRDANLAELLSRKVHHRPHDQKKRHAGVNLGGMSHRKRLKAYDMVIPGSNKVVNRYYPGFYLSRKNAPPIAFDE